VPADQADAYAASVAAEYEQLTGTAAQAFACAAADGARLL